MPVQRSLSPAVRLPVIFRSFLASGGCVLSLSCVVLLLYLVLARELDDDGQWNYFFSSLSH